MGVSFSVVHLDKPSGLGAPCKALPNIPDSARHEESFAIVQVCLGGFLGLIIIAPLLAWPSYHKPWNSKIETISGVARTQTSSLPAAKSFPKN